MSFANDNSRCTIGTYAAIDATTISVNNSGISTTRFGQAKRMELLGQGVQINPNSRPNQLKVTFNFNNKISDFFANLGSMFSNIPNYKVVDTDYESYALSELNSLSISLNNSF